MEKEIKFLTKKNDAIKELNKDLEEAIKHKNDNLSKVVNQLKPNQINYNNKLNELNKNLSVRGQLEQEIQMIKKEKFIIKHQKQKMKV